PRSKDGQLDSGLEKLRTAFQIKPVQHTIPISYLQSQIFGQVPVDHRGKSPKLPSIDRTTVKIKIGNPKDTLNLSPSTLEDRFFHRDKRIDTRHRTVRTGSSCED